MNGLDAALEKQARGGFGRADAETVWASADLIRIGMAADAARLARTGRIVTFGRVHAQAGGTPVAPYGEAREIRLTGRPTSFEEALAWTRAAVDAAPGVVVTGFALSDLAALSGHDHLTLADGARALAGAGLAAVADAAVDQLGEAELAAELVRAVRHGGLAVDRLLVAAAPSEIRLDLIARAAEVARLAGDIKAFAPLPRVDPTDVPSTGHDDVKTVAIARLWCDAIERIQVDWPLYGPKLAQVALIYGASDLDGVAAVDALQLGHRRAPAEDIARQIRSAGSDPVERDGRFRLVS